MVSQKAFRQADSARVSCDAEQHNCAGARARRPPHTNDGRNRGRRFRRGSAVRSPGLRARPRDFSVDLNHSVGPYISAALACALRKRPRSSGQTGQFPSRGSNDPILVWVNPDLVLVYPNCTVLKIHIAMHFIVDFTHTLGFSPTMPATIGTLSALPRCVATKDAHCSAADVHKDADGD